MEIRARRDGDLAPLAAAIERSNEADRWPPHWPLVDGGFSIARYLTSRDELAAFVAMVNGAVVGHIALHRAAAPSVVELACDVLGRSRDACAFVARMYVVPQARRHGVAGALLTHAATHAAALGRTAVLDVWDQLRAANSLYDANGWRELGRVTIAFGSSCSPRCAHQGDHITSVVRAAPA